MDFITDFLKSKKLNNLNIYNYILVIINQFIKIIYYILTIKKLKVKEFTHFMLQKVIKYYNILKIIINDHKMLFIFNF